MATHETADDAVARVRSGERVFIQGAAATPTPLVDALVRRAAELEDVELIHLHTEGDCAYAAPEYAGTFSVASLFVGANLRPYLDDGRVDYLPCFLSQMPQLLRAGKRPLDHAFVQVSPPDRHGWCSLGTSVDVTHAAVEVAREVVAVINPRMPRVHGDGLIHVSRMDHFHEAAFELPERTPNPLSEQERAIGRHVAGLILDGATIQMGIGSIPNAVCAELGGHRHLGIHTEMWSDGALDLIEGGAVDNSRKHIHPGKTVASFVMGSRRVYDFIDDNPSVLNLDVAYVNDPAVIARNADVVAINSAVEIDLTGQVCADSVGTRIISGVGGQLDFMRGAAMSEGGMPIIGLTSRTRRGNSRIVPVLRRGAGVVTTRAHVQHVVTEHGVVDLWGKTMGERARLLIDLAHPDDREDLERAWRDRTA